MIHVHDAIRHRLLAPVRAVEEIEEPKIRPSQMQSSEWSKEFEQLQRNRLVFGAYRYGKLKVTGKPQYNRVQSMIQRLSTYNATGNDELLVDVANLCMVEFVEGNHPDKHFDAVDDGPHCTRKGNKL